MTAHSNWLVYLLQCSDGTLYCGVTNDIEKRVAAHNAGTGARYTRSRLPVALICCSREMSKSDAFKLEYRVKRSPARKKRVLVEGAGTGEDARRSAPGKRSAARSEIVSHGVKLLLPNHERIRRLKRASTPTNHGHKVWPSSWLLADYLETNRLPDGCRVLEIGCGWGLIGNYCAKRFGARVTCADGDEAVEPFVMAMADENGVAMEFRCLDFESVRRPVLRGIDFVIGSDICFCDTLIDPIRRLVDRAGRSGVKRVILSDPGRWPFEDLSENLLRRKGAALVDWKIRTPVASTGQIMTVSF